MACTRLLDLHALRDGLFDADEQTCNSMFTIITDKTHAERRRIISHVYSLSNVLRSEKYLDRCSELFLHHLREYAEKPDSVMDLGKWLHMYAFDVVGELYFGNAFGFLEHSHDHGGWMHSMHLLMPLMCMCAVAPAYIRPLILASSLVVPGSLKAFKAMENIAASARACVKKRFNQDPQVESWEKRTDMLQQLYDIHVDKGFKVDFNMGDIEQEAHVALFAGADTTSIAFRATFYYLLKNPQVYREIQQEIDHAVEAGLLRSPVKYSEAIQLPLLCASIKEAFRMHPAVQLTMGRVSPAGGMEVCGTYIPEGYWVGMNPAIIHLDKSIFGGDADQFRPTRWLEPNAINMDKHMLTFGAGTRVCIGKNISLAEIHKLVPEVVRHFDLELANNDNWKTTNLWFCSQEMGPVRVRQREM